MNVNRLAAHAAVVCGVVILVGCAKSDTKTDSATAMADSSAMATTTATSAGTMAAPINLADIAGTWKFRSTPTTGTDTSATEYTLTATNNTEGWKIKYKNGLEVPVRITTAGDSVITDAGPYKSVRRKGVEVTTHGAFRKEGDRLVGMTTAHYNTKGADSVLVLRTEGTKDTTVKK